MASVSIINTGVANIRSLQAAFDRLDCNWRLTRDPNEIAEAEFCVLPGVGTFGAAMEMLNEFKLCDSIVDRINADRPTLAVCLGLQLLCQSSEEQPGVTGLGIVPRQIRRFDETVQIPQLGWNDVTPQGPGYFEAGEAYFANSFRLVDPPDDWSFAITEYGGPFVSSFWRGRILACQFHPELSGQWGGQLVKNWIEGRTVSC